MIIYDAAIFEKGVEHGNPETELGTFISLKAAQAIALDEKIYLDQEPLVYVRELQGEEFQVAGIWWEDRSGPAPAWKYRQEE